MQKDEIVPFGRLPAIPVPARGETLPNAMRSIGRQQQCSQPSRYAGEPMDRRCWKHSRQNTGRPCVGRKGTVVSFPHCEQVALVSDRWTLLPWLGLWERLALQSLHRLGSFLKPLSAKNICSPAVKTNSWLHSEHFRTLSWYSIRYSEAPRWLHSPQHPCPSQIVLG
jgi:hypothetical protein